MTKVFMTKFGEGKGNCLQASVASIMDLPIEDICVFGDGDVPEWLKRFNNWLKKFDLFALTIRLEDQGQLDFFGVHVACGESVVGGETHAVVYDGNKMIHDPHPTIKGIKNVDFRIVFCKKFNEALVI